MSREEKRTVISILIEADMYWGLPLSERLTLIYRVYHSWIRTEYAVQAAQ